MAEIGFRLDAGSGIGSGHLMRCAALASEMRLRGWRTRLFGSAETLALAAGLSAFSDVVTLTSELAAVTQVLPRDLDLLVLDHYGLNARYPEALRRDGLPVLSFSDVVQAMSCDILLDQNAGRRAADYAGLVEDGTLCLCGSRYVLLRSVFLQNPRPPLAVRAEARNILLTFGGSDPDDATGHALAHLRRAARPHWRIKAVLGPSYAGHDRLKADFSDWPALDLVHAPSDLWAAMSWADVCLTAAGTTCWELCYLGIPFVVTSLGTLPNGNAQQLQALDAAFDAGSIDAIRDGDFIAPLTALMTSEPERLRLAGNARSLVDGQGARRVCDHIGKLL